MSVEPAMSPTIHRLGRFQVAKVKMSGFKDRLGVREGDNMPWVILGDPASVAYALFYGSTAYTTSLWVEASAPAGPTTIDGIRISSMVKGAAFRSMGSVPEGLPRDIRVGIKDSYDILADLPDLLPLKDLVTQIAFNPSIMDSWVPVDADLSEHSKGVDYGRAV